MTVDRSYYTNAFDEWKETRSVIARFDGYLDGLRRYGFVFIAALLAANSIQAYSSFSNITKVFLSIITIAFIVGLFFLDVYYRRMIEAASIRARVLETAVLLDTELNEVTYDKFKKEKRQKYIKCIYIGFILVTVIVGVAVIVTTPKAPASTLVNSDTLSITLENSDTLSTTIENSSTLSTTIVNSGTRLTTPLNFINESSMKLLTWMLIIILSLKLFYFIKEYLKDESDKHKKSIKLFGKSFIASSVDAFIVMVLIIYFITVTNWFCRELIDFESTRRYIYLLISSGAIGTFFISFFSNNLILEFLHGNEDWIIDKFSCGEGEKVRITFTNLSGEEIVFGKGKKLFDIYRQNEKLIIVGTETQKEESSKTTKYGSKSEIKVPSYGSYSWLWDTKGSQVGIYRIKPRDWDYPLRRSVYIHEKSEKQTESNDKKLIIKVIFINNQGISK
ncbi:hypothetical protein [Methanosarcina sp. 2.H.A.1B.4]|uniref:hypothetical protein n=1 Tax=Methanosarcina sp. 2.H.A.1B.4 TaxID=1483600 RepID=UPI0006219AAB|nr:hypothetical protein [Methanosarcina sp. 2.H.A.1B.4]KKG13072.1 hypothetical protein EO92_07855 [Methanosarcina sp. 2.H.A.1B.4]